MKRAAESLAEEYNDPLIASNFGIAEKYHRDFYHLFMEDEEWTTDRPKVRDFVDRVLGLTGCLGYLAKQDAMAKLRSRERA